MFGTHFFVFICIVKPGARYRDFGKIIEDHATKNGFSVVRAFCGHGINQLFHCAPNVHHYASKLTKLEKKRYGW